MGWRPGESWLETDLVWFREGAGAPLLAGVAPVQGAGVATPPGLVASRLRRAAWEQRRRARRARAKLVAISPAVVFLLAGLRSSSGYRSGVVAEDRPGLTFQLSDDFVADSAGRPQPGARHDGLRTARRSSPALTRHQARRKLARADAPKIAWHHATSVGLPYDGTLIDGTQLPIEGPNWVTWDPVTDSVPNAPRRLYGNEHTIRAILAVTAAYRAANTQAPRVVIGDISLEGGGPMTDEHVSHQNGLDVDVYYPRLDGALRAPDAPDQIDRRLAQDLLDRFVAAGAQMIFVGYSTGLEGPAGIVIPYPNHEYHMHVRFPPPAG